MKFSYLSLSLFLASISANADRKVMITGGNSVQKYSIPPYPATAKDIEPAASLEMSQDFFSGGAAKSGSRFTGDASLNLYIPRSFGLFPGFSLGSGLVGGFIGPRVDLGFLGQSLDIFSTVQGPSPSSFWAKGTLEFDLKIVRLFGFAKVIDPLTNTFTNTEGLEMDADYGTTQCGGGGVSVGPDLISVTASVERCRFALAAIGSTHFTLGISRAYGNKFKGAAKIKLGNYLIGLEVARVIRAGEERKGMFLAPWLNREDYWYAPVYAIATLGLPL